MRILVCGGRKYNNYDRVFEVLERFVHKASLIIHGGAKGADTLAGIVAKELEIPCNCYEADWEKDGKAAGIIRNRRMLHEGKPNLVISFNGGRGTENMIRIAKRAGIRVIEIVDNPLW